MHMRSLRLFCLNLLMVWIYAAQPVWVPLAPLAQAAPEVVPQRNDLAILDFNARGGVSQDEAAIITDRLRSQMFQTGRYRLMERANMLSLLREQGFQQTQQNCESTDCSVALGKMLAVRQLMTGSVSRLGSIYTLSYRIVDVEKGVIVADNFHDCRCTLEEVLTQLTQTLVAGLSRNGSGTVTLAPASPLPEVAPAEMALEQLASLSIETRQAYYQHHQKYAFLGLLLNTVPFVPFGYIYLDRWDSFWSSSLWQIGLAAVGGLFWFTPYVFLTAYLLMIGIWVYSWFDAYREAELYNQQLGQRLRLTQAEPLYSVPLLAWRAEF